MIINNKNVITVGIMTETHGTWAVNVQTDDEEKAKQYARTILWADHHINDIIGMHIMRNPFVFNSSDVQ